VLPPACSPLIFGLATNARADAELCLDLDQIVREGARRMLAAALEAEVDAYLAAHAAPSGTRVAGGWWSAMAMPAPLH
jgi:hypothetical protein